MSDLRTYINELIQKVLDEESVSGDAGGYNSKFFLAKKKKNTYPPGWKQTSGMPKTSKVYDYKELWKGKKSSMNEDDKQNQNKKQSKEVRPFIPPEFEMPPVMFEPVKLGTDKEPKILFKVASRGNDHILLIDPLAKTALDAIERGRSSFEKESRLPEVVKFVKEKVPPGVRGLIKKHSQGAKIGSSGYIVLPLVLRKGRAISLKNSIISINEKGIKILKAVKANPAKGEGFENQIQLLIWLYRNRDKSELTPSDYATSEGVSEMMASRVSNELQKSSAIDLKQSNGEENDETWFVLNPFRDTNIMPNINTPLYESIAHIVKNKLLTEQTYNKFKSDVKYRTKNEMLHKGIKEVKRKLNEVDRIVEYVSRMKGELMEGEEGIKYWKTTEKYVGQIAETLNKLNNKIKNLNQ